MRIGESVQANVVGQPAGYDAQPQRHAPVTQCLRDLIGPR